MSTEILEHLHRGLSERHTPEMVVLNLRALGQLNDLPPELDHQVEWLSRRTPSQMRTTYQHHPGLERPYRSAADLMHRVETTAGLKPVRPANADNIIELKSWVRTAIMRLGMWPDHPNTSHRGARACHGSTPHPRSARHGHVDFRHRISAGDRRNLLPGVSNRLYKSAVRAVLHLQERVTTWEHRLQFETNVQLGKARLAPSITRTSFEEAPKTAAFVAYYVSRLGLRTLFTGSSQVRPMDDLAEELLRRALPEGRFDLLSRVLTYPRFLAMLSNRQVDVLALEYRAHLEVAAETLARLHDPKRDRREMVVRRGDDSSQWNAATRAFNQARAGLLNLAQVSDRVAADLDEHLPGKVPTLVAADIAHVLFEGALHQDLQVWSELPNPWEVVLDGVKCTRTDVEEICTRYGIDPEKSGWTLAYRQNGTEPVESTPDLVHGVALEGPPEIVEDLRKAGVFSGK